VIFHFDGRKNYYTRHPRNVGCHNKSIQQLAAEGRMYYFVTDNSSTYKALDSSGGLAPENVIVKFNGDKEGSFKEATGG